MTQPQGQLGQVVDHAIALGVVGPPEHGIPRLAHQIAVAAVDVGFRGEVVQESDPGELETLADRLPGTVRLLHLQVNDWLFATEKSAAGPRFEALAARLAERDVRLSLTLHDLPQPSDGPALNNRRVEDYRSMVRSAVGTVVSSEHEHQLLVDAIAGAGRAVAGSTESGNSPVRVIPLPIDALPENSARHPAANDSAPTVGIFGYLYPGKGHHEVLEELAGIDPAVTVLGIGRPSERHGDLLAELQTVAGKAGVEFRCTGYLPDGQVPAQLRAVTVPVAPHTHVSASGSINSWLAAGRRPLVPAGRYVEELDIRMPGAIWSYRPGELRQSVIRALDDPELTMLPKDLVVGPTTAAVAEEYLAWLRRLVRPA